MINILKIDTITQTLMPLAFHEISIPTPLQTPLRILYAAHFVSKSAEEIRFYSSHTELFVGGRIFQRALGSTPGIPYIAQTILIATSILKTTEKTIQIKQLWERLIDVASGTFGSPVVYFQEELTQKPAAFRKDISLFSCASTLPLPAADLAVRIEEVVLTILDLMRALWDLVRALIDFFDACLLDRCSESEAMLGVGANMVRAYTALTNNCYLLAKECEKSEKTVDHVLRFFGNQMKAKDFIPIIAQKAEQFEWTQKLIAKGWHEAKEVSIDASFYLLAANIGYAHPGLISANRLHKTPYYPIRRADEVSSHTTCKTDNRLHRFYNSY